MTHLPMSSSVILCMQYFLPLALNPLVTFKNTNNCQRLSSFISNTFQYIMLDMCHSLGTAVEPVSCCRAEEFVRRETVLCGAYTEKNVSHNGGRICVTSAVPAHMLVINVNLPHQGTCYVVILKTGRTRSIYLSVQVL